MTNGTPRSAGALKLADVTVHEYPVVKCQKQLVPTGKGLETVIEIYLENGMQGDALQCDDLHPPTTGISHFSVLYAVLYSKCR